MSSEDKTKIIVAVLGLLSAVGVATISNFDKIFVASTAETVEAEAVADTSASAETTSKAARPHPTPRPAASAPPRQPRPQPSQR